VVTVVSLAWPLTVCYLFDPSDPRTANHRWQTTRFSPFSRRPSSKENEGSFLPFFSTCVAFDTYQAYE